MKIRIGTMAMVMLLTGVAGVRAQVADAGASPTIIVEGAPTSDLPLADYQAFAQFAAAHPEIISNLARDAHLLENPDYLVRHPQLRDFLATHAELRDSLISDPGKFIELQGHHPQ